MFTKADMRSSKLLLVLPVLVASFGLGACAAPSEDNTDDQSQDVTGGSSSVESPVAFLFETTAADAPKCAGAMISDTMAVTARSCAKEGLVLGRAMDKDGHGARATVKAVHLSAAKDADIAVVELDRSLKGPIAVVTHTEESATHAPTTEGEPVTDETGSDNGSCDPLPDFTPTKKKSDSSAGSGCSMTSRSARLTSSLPLVGVVVALAAILRRRKKPTADS